MIRTKKYVVKLIEVDVDSITKTHDFPFAVRGKQAVLGVLDGDWDLMTKEFTHTQLFTSIEMRIRYQANWADTPFYQKQQTKIISGKKAENNCRSLSDLNAHCASIDALHQDMTHNGYRIQYNEQSNRKIQGVSIPDEIRIAIGRDGQLIRCASGRHRLAVAKILGIAKIPAIVQIEHKNWDGALDIIKRLET